MRPGTWDPETWDLKLQDPETQDPGTLRSGTLRPGTLEPGTLRPWEPDTQKPGNTSLGLWNWDFESQKHESRTLRIQLVTQIQSILTWWKARAYKSKTWPRCWSRWTKTFTKIFWHLAKHKEIRKYLKVMVKCIDRVYVVEKGSKRQESKFPIS